jgi:hypothetical protein
MNIPKFNPIPIIGGRPQPTEQQMQSQVQAAIQSLAMQLYIKTASAQTIADTHSPKDVYRELSKQCHTAARAYFEAAGIIQETPEEEE